MEKFVLKVKDGERINCVDASSLDEAEKHFAQTKRLGLKTLLKLFVVEVTA